MTKITLYDYFRSTASYRVRIALNLKSLSYDIIPVHLVKDGGQQYQEEYKTINPQSLLPSLKVDNDVLTQSVAIMEYLDEVHPEPSILPGNALDRARIRSLSQIITSDMHPVNNLRVLQFLKENFDSSDEKKMIWYHHWLQKGFEAFEARLTTDSNTGAFCHGDLPTMADICLVAQLYNAFRFEFELRPYPTILSIYEKCQELAAFKAAYPAE